MKLMYVYFLLTFFIASGSTTVAAEQRELQPLSQNDLLRINEFHNYVTPLWGKMSASNEPVDAIVSMYLLVLQHVPHLQAPISALPPSPNWRDLDELLTHVDSLVRYQNMYRRSGSSLATSDKR